MFQIFAQVLKLSIIIVIIIITIIIIIIVNIIIIIFLIIILQLVLLKNLNRPMCYFYKKIKYLLLINFEFYRLKISKTEPY